MQSLKDHGREFLSILKTMFLIYVYEQYSNQSIKRTSCVKNGLEGNKSRYPYTSQDLTTTDQANSVLGC